MILAVSRELSSLHNNLRNLGFSKPRKTEELWRFAKFFLGDFRMNGGEDFVHLLRVGSFAPFFEAFLFIVSVKYEVSVRRKLVQAGVRGLSGTPKNEYFKGGKVNLWHTIRITVINYNL